MSTASLAMVSQIPIDQRLSWEKEFKALYWGVTTNHPVFFQYLRCKIVQEAAFKFLADTLWAECQSLDWDLGAKKKFFSKVWKSIQCFDLLFYKNNPICKTPEKVARLAYQELNRKSLTRAIQRSMKSIKPSIHLNHEDFLALINLILFNVQKEVIDLIFHRFKNALKKVFYNQNLFKRVWKIIISEQTLASRNMYEYWNEPKAYLCGYCLTLFKELQEMDGSDGLFLGSRSKEKDAEVLIKQMCIALRCIQSKKPTQIAWDILDILCGTF